MVGVFQAFPFQLGVAHELIVHPAGAVILNEPNVVLAGVLGLVTVKVRLPAVPRYVSAATPVGGVPPGALVILVLKLTAADAGPTLKGISNSTNDTERISDQALLDLHSIGF